MKRSAAVLFAILFALPMLRIAATYFVFSETTDETVHIGSGMEWLVTNGYVQDLEHPPLARIAFAVLPYLDGGRDPNGDALISRNWRPLRNLALARAGNLIFLAIALFVVAIWTARMFGLYGSLLAVALFGAIPAVLAHSGLATTDCAAMAMFLFASYRLARWLAVPSWRNTVWCGVAIGAGLLSKFSFLVFFPALAFVFMATRRTIPRLAQAGAAIVIGFLLVWAGYKFSAGTIHNSERNVSYNKARQRSVDRLAADYAENAGYRWVRSDIIERYWRYADDARANRGREIDFVDWAKAAGYPSPLAGRSGRDTMAGAPPVRMTFQEKMLEPVHRAMHRVVIGVRLPAPAFFTGIGMVRRHSEAGHFASLFGKVSMHGWWYYFPVVLFFKTPLAFFVLSIAGMALLLRDGNPEMRGVALAPLAILLPAMTSGINIGVRHILPLYPFMAICAAYAVLVMWRGRTRWLAAALVAWYMGVGALAHPNYLAWFNEVSGSHPENIANDSNLDWGQDVARLTKFVRREHIPHIWVDVGNGWRKYGLPGEPLPAGRRVTGWIAVGEHHLQRDHNDGWLQSIHSFQRIGQSIRLYYIP